MFARPSQMAKLINGKRLHLPGLRMQPLAPHLSALAILRLVNEQWLPECRGGWHGGHFFLEEDLDEDALLDFLFLRYQPAPIASPWNKGSGFYPGADLGPCLAIESSTADRFRPYRETLQAIRTVLAEQGLVTSPTGQAKVQLMKELMGRLPEAGLAWLRAVYRVVGDRAEYNPLLFNGGVESKFDYALSFMAVVKHALMSERRQALRRAHLRAYLLDTPVDGLRPQTNGAIDPASALALNGSSLGDGQPLSNPWAFLFGMEGLLHLSQAHHMRPPTAAGQPSLIRSELEKPDLWLPVWSQPMTFIEMSQALQSRSSLLTGRVRFAAVPRNGRVNFLIPVSYRPLLAKAFWMEPKRWLLENGRLSEGYTRAIARHSDSGAPADTLARALEELGKLKLHASEMPSLQHGWIDRRDQSIEMSLALSIAGLGGGSDMHRDLGLRWHMNAFRGPDLCAMMISLARRRIDVAGRRSKKPNRHGIIRFNAPFWSCYPVSVEAVDAFLTGSLDEARVVGLVHALCLLEPGFTAQMGRSNVYRLPLHYRYLKLAFHQQARDRRPAPRDMLEHLSLGRIDDAIRTASFFLDKRHSGLLDLTGLPTEPAIGPRLAASMVLPISDELYDELRLSVCTGARV